LGDERAIANIEKDVRRDEVRAKPCANEQRAIVGIERSEIDAAILWIRRPAQINEVSSVGQRLGISLAGFGRRVVPFAHCRDLSARVGDHEQPAERPAVYRPLPLEEDLSRTPTSFRVTVHERRRDDHLWRSVGQCDASEASIRVEAEEPGVWRPEGPHGPLGSTEQPSRRGTERSKPESLDASRIDGDKRDLGTVGRDCEIDIEVGDRAGKFLAGRWQKRQAHFTAGSCVRR
jgi:hypothetical protein